MKKTLLNLAGGVLLPIVLLASPVKAQEIKSHEIKRIRYNDSCFAFYKENNKGYNILQVTCDNGYNIHNPDGDYNANKICFNKWDSWKGCYNPNDVSESDLSFEQAEYLFGTANKLIGPDGEIVKTIIQKDIEEETNKFRDSQIGNQPKVDLKKIGRW